MLTRIDESIDARLNVAFETTLPSLSYARKIPAWQLAGCSVALVYLRLANVEMSLERVRRRVAQGGHGVPEAVIRKRFLKSFEYFERLYKPLVNEWYI
jgi:predicted ABC-type ATPase